MKGFTRGPIHSLIFLGLVSIAMMGCTSKLNGTDTSSGSLGSGAFSLQALHKTTSLQSVCSVQVPKPEPSNLASLATATQDQAVQAALAAFPGTTVLSSDLDNENGCLVYGIQLDNGADVKVDAGNGVMLYADTGADSGTDQPEGASSEG